MMATWLVIVLAIGAFYGVVLFLGHRLSKHREEDRRRGYRRNW